MSKNIETRRFSDLCELVGCDQDEFINHFETFITECHDRGKLDDIPHQIRNDLFAFLHRAKINDVVDDQFTQMFSAYVFLISMASMDPEAIENLLASSPDDLSIENISAEQGMAVNVEDIEKYDPELQTLISCAVTFAEWARGVKINECIENVGPQDLIGTIAYFTLKEDVDPEISIDALNADHFVINLGQLMLEQDGDDPIEVLRQMLDDAYENEGPAVIIGFVCDTYMREVESETSLYDGSLTNVDLADEYIRPGSGVRTALATVIMSSTSPVVSTVSSYTYDDNGLPVFDKSEYGVIDRTIAMRDITQRGMIAKLFAEYLARKA